jgi:hypothetical protein
MHYEGNLDCFLFKKEKVLKKLLKFLMLLICVFVASNLKLDAGSSQSKITVVSESGEQRQTRQPAQHKREEIQNSKINVYVDHAHCEILKRVGFSEVKTYLQSHPKIISLSLVLKDNTRQIPEGYFVGLDHLQQIDLGTNRLTSLPESIKNLTNLRELNLYENRLTSLPTEIGNLRELRVLDLSFNLLTYLPAEIRRLTNLKELDLGNNLLIPWPTELIDRLRIQNEDISIAGQDHQAPALQSTQPVSFFKRIGSKIKFAFSKIFKRKA